MFKSLQALDVQIPDEILIYARRRGIYNPDFHQISGVFSLMPAFQAMGETYFIFPSLIIKPHKMECGTVVAVDSLSGCGRTGIVYLYNNENEGEKIFPHEKNASFINIVVFKKTDPESWIAFKVDNTPRKPGEGGKSNLLLFYHKED